MADLMIHPDTEKVDIYYESLLEEYLLGDIDITRLVKFMMENNIRTIKNFKQVLLTLKEARK